jgi:hypothetical protein
VPVQGARYGRERSKEKWMREGESEEIEKGWKEGKHKGRGGGRGRKGVGGRRVRVRVEGEVERKERGRGKRGVCVCVITILCSNLKHSPAVVKNAKLLALQCVSPNTSAQTST